MSYRNPTYYGIVEDMGAFNKAFQSTFNQFQQVIQTQQAKEAENKQRLDDLMGQGYAAVLKSAEDLEGNVNESFIDIGNAFLEDINFANQSASNRQKILQRISMMGKGTDKVEELKENLAIYAKHMEPGIVNGVSNFLIGKNKLEREGAGADARLYINYEGTDGEQQKLYWDQISSVFNPNFLTVQGDKNYSADLIKNGVDVVENELEIIAKQNKGVEITDEQVNEVLKKWATSNKDELTAPQMDFTWNSMGDKNKKLELEDGEIDLSNYDYTLQKFRTNPNFKNIEGVPDLNTGQGKSLIDHAEDARNMIIEKYIRGKIARNIEKPFYAADNPSSDDLKNMSRKQQSDFYGSILSDVYKPNFKTPPIIKDFPFQIPSDINLAAITTEKGRKQAELIQFGNDLGKKIPELNIQYLQDDNDIFVGFNVEIGTGPLKGNNVEMKLDMSPESIDSFNWK